MTALLFRPWLMDSMMTKAATTENIKTAHIICMGILNGCCLNLHVGLKAFLGFSIYK